MLYSLNKRHVATSCSSRMKPLDLARSPGRVEEEAKGPPRCRKGGTSASQPNPRGTPSLCLGHVKDIVLGDKRARSLRAAS